jgi:hypothetical protein
VKDWLDWVLAIGAVALGGSAAVAYSFWTKGWWIALGLAAMIVWGCFVLRDPDRKWGPFWLW